MDEKHNEEAPKISRSRARHLRRKRLIIARRAANGDSKSPLDSHNSPKNNENPEIISKSKARRLRKKNKQNPSQSPPSISFDNSEVNSTNSSTIDECRLESAKNRQELINNEKNLKSQELRDSFINSDINIYNLSAVTSAENDVSSVSHAATPPAEPPVPTSSQPNAIKMNADAKTREQIKAERESKKAAKAAAKNKVKTPKAEAPKPAPVPKNPPVTNCSSKPGKSPAKTALSDAEVEEEIEEVRDELSKLTVSDRVLPVGSLCPVPTLTEKRLETNRITASDEKKPESKSTTEGKSKAELRAERRAKQEAQRAAKEQQKKVAAKPAAVEPAKVPKSVEKVLLDDSVKNHCEKPTRTSKESSHELNLFKHLYHEREQAFLRTPAVNSSIHPAIVRLGVQYANKVIVGSNARCIALLAAVKQLIQDFERPSQADFTRGLETSLQESSSYLHHCRPLAVSMYNALRHLKWQMTQLPSTISDNEAKAKLGSAIDTYIQEQILLADQAISITIQTKISNGDVILTYGCSSLIQKILCEAYDKGKKFRVVVVDGRPWLEGKELLRRLAKHGVECSYILINALSFIMPEVSKVFLGAHAILANGAVMSRAGTAQVALMAKAFNVPVLVACETHKTCERVQTDSIVYNEIGDADELAQSIIGSSRKTSVLTNWRARKSLNLLNLTYDVTPADLVTAVVTELAILPCTSVPVILRIKPSEI